MTKCRTCKKDTDSGIWVDSQFKDSPIFHFCSEDCKSKYIEMKMNRLKTNYPDYYKKVLKVKESDKYKKVL